MADLPVQVPPPPEDLDVTWAWDELFLEFNPHRAQLEPPTLIAPAAAIAGVFVVVLGVGSLGSFWIGIGGLLVIQLAILLAVVHRRSARNRLEMRLLVRLGRDRLELRHKILGVVEREQRLEVAHLGAPRVVVADGEPRIELETPAGPLVIPMYRHEPQSARWLSDRIEERRAAALDRVGAGVAEVPADLGHLVHRRTDRCQS